MLGKAVNPRYLNGSSDKLVRTSPSYSLGCWSVSHEKSTTKFSVVVNEGEKLFADMNAVYRLSSAEVGKLRPAARGPYAARRQLPRSTTCRYNILPQISHTWIAKTYPSNATLELTQACCLLSWHCFVANWEIHRFSSKCFKTEFLLSLMYV